MPRSLLNTSIIAFWLLMGLVARAEVNPDLPVEFIPFQPATLVDPTISAQVQFLPVTNSFIYTYGVTSLPSSRQMLFIVAVGTDVPSTNVTGANLTAPNLPTPEAWVGGWSQATDFWPAAVTWNPLNGDGCLDPGERIEGLAFESIGIPSIGTCWIQGDVPPPSGQQVVLPPPEGFSDKLVDNSVKRQTVVPVAPPTTDPGALIDRLATLKENAFSLGWIDNHGTVTSLDSKLNAAKQQIIQGNTNAAANVLNAFLNELGAQKGKHVNDTAYYLLKANADFIISKLRGSPTALIPGPGSSAFWVASLVVMSLIALVAAAALALLRLRLAIGLPQPMANASQP